ncbi:DinB family protein [Streptomyces hoynatensis]|uniref:DinB family protein n=1 Tax=Streptomyces hoynatensis TaxID=1141874 RepID=A0A3A9Z717_9ACTN|nr:DinB family protein [Streptomyces hoynatensis]RKN43839.1 DinB family protein [Streptomyces hoynatensis]
MIDERLGLPPDADERTTLTCFLDFQRNALVRTCAGLTDEQLRLRAAPPSGLSLLGLVRHLAGVERWYFQAVMAGTWPGGLYTRTDDPDEDFNDIENATGAAAFATWRAEVAASRAITAERPLDAIGAVPEWADERAGRRYSLRWVLTHMIDEYARHNGHADLIREAIDGQVGE